MSTEQYRHFRNFKHRLACERRRTEAHSRRVDAARKGQEETMEQKRAADTPDPSTETKRARRQQVTAELLAVDKILKIASGLRPAGLRYTLEELSEMLERLESADPEQVI